jgi:hypothetical protein
VLERAGPPDAIAHADWTCGNVRFHDGQVSSSYDWDSLAAAPEPVLVGLSAGSFTSGGIGAAQDGRPGAVTFAFFSDPEGHVVGLSKGAVQ